MPEFSPFTAADVDGFLHRPNSPCGCALALTHGAGSNCRTALLTAVADAFASAGFVVLRFDLAFRRDRTGGPLGAAQQARDRESVRSAAAALRQMAPGKLLLGGHSYGGRQSTMLASDDPAVADGLMLLSYPLHPPKRSDQLRTAHFPSLLAPALFVHGSRDGMGSVEEMRAALPLIPAATRLEIVAGAGHDLSALVKKSAGSLPQFIEYIGQLVPGMEHHQAGARVSGDKPAR